MISGLISGGTILNTGAFSSVEADRTVSVTLLRSTLLVASSRAIFCISLRRLSFPERE